MRISCFVVESVVVVADVVVVFVVAGVAEHFVVSGIADFVEVSMDSLLRFFFDERNIERKLNWLFLR